MNIKIWKKIKFFTLAAKFHSRKPMSGAGSLVDLDQQIFSNRKYWWETDPNKIRPLLYMKAWRKTTASLHVGEKNVCAHQLLHESMTYFRIPYLTQTKVEFRLRSPEVKCNKMGRGESRVRNCKTFALATRMSQLVASERLTISCHDHYTNNNFDFQPNRLK